MRLGAGGRIAASLWGIVSTVYSRSHAAFLCSSHLAYSQWISAHGHASVGRPARTYIDQLCKDAGCCAERLPDSMNDREGWISVQIARPDDDDDITIQN